MLFKSRRRVPASSADQLAHDRLTNLINSMADAVLAVDHGLRVVVYNGAALNILDRNGSVEGERISDIFHPLDKNNRPVDIAKLVGSVRIPTTTTDLRLRYSDTSVINLYISIVPVHQGYGAKGQQGYVLLMRDITREKSLEEERDEFISVVSHELRTPIAITEGNISNAQYVAEKSGDIGQIKQALDQAHSQIMFLSDLINDLSMFSRAERDKLAVSVEPIDVRGLLQELQNNYASQAKDKGLALEVRLSSGLEKPLASSRLYVHEILQNFITNSLKYTEKGSVTISAESRNDGVLFSVADTGIGISHGDQKRVFDKFFRSEDYRTRKTNGTGLGLYVTAKLVQLLHAHVSLESELNKGSTFTVFIPNLSVPTAGQAAPAASSSTAHRPATPSDRRPLHAAQLHRPSQAARRRA